MGIHGVDLSQFGGPILPGALAGNTLTLKAWVSSEQTEYDATYDITSGSGTFDGLFTAIREVSTCEIPEGACDCDGNVLDECGVCDGPGAVYECGCSDIAVGVNRVYPSNTSWVNRKLNAPNRKTYKYWYFFINWSNLKRISG